MTDTRLRPSRYLELLHADGERLLEVAEGAMDRPVPTCPGWTVDDLVFHVGSVYSHKRVALALGRQPEEGEWTLPPEDAAPDDDLRWCHDQLHGLAGELAQRDPSDAAWTWWPADQTVGFWQRRMALETAVHRVDAELTVGEVTPVAADLALDGIDEVLRVMLASDGVDDVTGPEIDGDVIRVGIAGTVVAGDPSDLLLWLWGRGDDSHVEVRAGSVEALRALLQESMQ